MVYVLTGNKDPITAATCIPKVVKWPANNLANSASLQPYQKSFGYNNYLPLTMGQNIFTGRNNNMGCCNTNLVSNLTYRMQNYGCCSNNSSGVNFFMPSFSCGNFGSSPLFTLNFGGTACTGGCNSGISGINVFPNFGSTCSTGYLGGFPMMSGVCSPFSGVYGFMPMFGGGSTSNGYGNVSYSPNGFASTNPFGSQVYSLDSHKSSNYNLGALGSYAKSGSNSAWNVLGLVSQTKSGGHKSLDASNLINTILLNA